MPSNHKVMILDDNLMDVMQAERHLQQSGYDVVKLSSPNGALSKIDFEEPEILLIDINMERLNADDLVQTLRDSPEYQDMVVVVYSDREADQLQQYCIENDVNGYYCKSMDVAEIGDFLDNFFE
jgi:PleD family two-component response regulator